MKTSVALSFAVISLASIIAGCGGSGNYATATSTPAPTPSATCTPPAGYTIQEVFPQNGQGGQPNLEGVVFDVGPSPQAGSGAPSPLPTNWFFYVTYNVTANPASAISSYPVSIGFLATPVPAPGSTAGTTPTPLPVPSDSPNPTFTNFIQETASNGTFANSAANNSQFTVYLANSNCYPGIPESTFSTAPTDLPSPSPTPTATAS